MAALPNPPPSPREAGVLALSECVTSASSREPRTQVHTVYNVRCHNVCLFSFESHFNLWWKSAQKRHSFFAELMKEEMEEEEGGTLARKVGEAVTNTIGVVVTAIDIPLGECCPKQDLKTNLM